MATTTIDRLDQIVESIARETPRQQRPAEARELAERWDLDAAKLLEWISLEAELEKMECTSPRAAWAVLVAGHPAHELALKIAQTRAAVLAEVR